MVRMRSLMSCRVTRMLVLGAVLAGASLAAHALINPKYPPDKLYEQAEWIVRADLGPLAETDPLPAKVTGVILGDGPKIPVLTPDQVDAQLLPELQAAFGDKQTVSGLLMVGNFSEAMLDSGGELEAKPVGALLIGTHWFALFPQDGGLRIGMDPLTLKAVWAGGDKTLEDCLRYVKRDGKRAKTPVEVGTVWSGDARVGALEGRASGMQILDVFGTGKNALFVASPDGDRLYTQNADGKLDDVTAKVKLNSKSSYFAWADIDLNGSLDLISVDDKGNVWPYNALADGTFVQRPAGTLSGGEAEPCAGIATFGMGRSLWAVVATPRPTVILVAPTNAFARLPFDPNPLDQPGPCVVADFNGDGKVDVVQVGKSGARFYAGIRMASDYRDLINQHMALFAAPIEASTADLGEGITSATIADFDQDGRPDILVTGKVGASFLINANAVGCTFVERYNDTGEVTYISKPNMVGAAVGDVNNDGRQDIAFLYADMNNQVFFNRGFRCFGHAIAMEGNAGLPCAKSLEDGQQAGALGDLNGDGAQDLAMVGVGGEVWVLYRETQASMKNLASTLGLTVTLPKGQIGPALVTAYDGARCLGVRVVTNSAPAFFGKTDKGPLKLVWRTAAGEQTKSVTVMKAQGLELAGLE